MTDVLLIGGRSGVGKTSVAVELHELLASRSVRHALIEGDTLDLAWPWPEDLAYRNLADIWRNYRDLGYSRVIYTNTVSVLDSVPLLSAIGGAPRAFGALLTASDETIRNRLAQREIGTALEEHVSRSRRAATRLASAPAWVTRIPTDGRPTPSLAHELATLTGWLPA
jgi:hypothetical protein